MSQPPRVDLLDSAFKADPYPTYARLRSSTPVSRAALPDGRGVWLITRYEDVLAVLKDEPLRQGLAQHPYLRTARPGPADTRSDEAPGPEHARHGPARPRAPAGAGLQGFHAAPHRAAAPPRPGDL